MNKQEFMNRLRAALTGRMSSDAVQEHVSYYEEYINTQIRMGRSEDEILGTLGNPRLIAKTIIETSGQSNTGDYDNYDYQSDGYRSTGQRTEYQYSGQQSPVRRIRIPGWLWAIIILLIILMIFGFIFSVLSFLAPVLVPILVVLFLVKLFRDWLN